MKRIDLWILSKMFSILLKHLKTYIFCQIKSRYIFFCNFPVFYRFWHNVRNNIFYSYTINGNCRQNTLEKKEESENRGSSLALKFENHSHSSKLTEVKEKHITIKWLFFLWKMLSIFLVFFWNGGWSGVERFYSKTRT